MDEGPALAFASAWLAPSGLAIAVLAYVALSLVVGARMALGRFATERIVEERGLEEGLDPGSRAWSATVLLRQLCLVAVPILALLAWSDPLRVALPVGLGTVLAGRLCQDVLAPMFPESALGVLSPVVRAIDFVVGPLVAPLARAFEHLVEKRQREAAEVDEDARDEQIEEYIRDAEEGGLFERAEGELVREIVDLGDLIVREVMTPRTEIAAVPAEAPAAEVARAVIESGHSRLPVFEGTIDRVLGVVSVRDLLPHLSSEEGEGVGVRELMRPVRLVPATKNALELLRELQSERQQMALVVDEYGGTSGLVTIEDLIEEIVGEIRDEHEDEEEPVLPDGQGGFVTDGLMSVEDLEELLDVDLPDESVETVGGLLFARLGRVPRLGERVEVAPGLVFEVARMVGRRIARVRVVPATGVTLDSLRGEGGSAT